MKKLVCVIVMILGILLSGGIAAAQNTWTTGAYADNADMSQTLSVSGAASLTVTVTGQTEKDYDFVYIYDSSSKEIKKLSGSINETFTVSDSSITVRLTSDKSVTDTGVTVSVASASSPSASAGLPKPDYDSGWFYVEKGKEYEKTHNLGTFPALVVKYGASDSSGSNMYLMDGVYEPSFGRRGCWLVQITKTSYRVKGGTASAYYDGITAPSPSNTWLKVLMWK